MRLISTNNIFGEEAAVYTLQRATDRGNARQLARSIDPDCLEIASEILDEANKVFGKVDRNMIFPMADHIAFAVKRIRRGEQIENPLTQDIMLIFHAEYKAAYGVLNRLRERMDVEIGYLAMHLERVMADELGYESD